MDQSKTIVVPEQNSRTIKDYAVISAKGIAMGAADVVPGVSGGTIAFIAGIYEELLLSIRSVNLDALKELKSNGIKAFLEKVNAAFLISLLLGIALSIVSLSKGILFLLVNYPVLVWSFFFGLIVASAIFVAKSIKNWNLVVVLALVAGTGIAYVITIVSPSETPTNLWFIFLTGAIAICAMILPGISGSFILLLMGKYEYILGAIHELKISVIAVFILGCVTGLLSFSHLLSWMFKKYHDLTIALLAGFMVGSLNKVWPWKEVLESKIINEKVKILKEGNLLPGSYAEITGNPSFIAGAVAFAILGFLMIFFLEKFASKKVKI